MDFSGETLFFTGVVIMAIAVIVALICFIALFTWKMRLNVKFDTEYGENNRRNKHVRDNSGDV